MRRMTASALLASLVTAALAAGSLLVSLAGTAQASAGSSAPAGHWGLAQRISLAGLKASDESIDKMSCPSPGNCTAVGSYDDPAGTQQAFVVSEVRGRWGRAGLIPGLNGLNKGSFDSVDALSCASPGNCALGGGYPNAAGDFQPFVASSVNGHWGRAHTLIAIDTHMQQFIAMVTSISCPKPGDCVAGVTLPEFIAIIGGGPANIIPSAFLASETGGTWSAVRPVEVPAGTSAPSAIESVSCWAPGNCLVGGFFTDASDHQLALIDHEAGGAWQTAKELPGVTSISGYNASGQADVDSLSCPGGTCTVGGSYQDGSLDRQDFVADPGAHGTLNAKTVPGSLELNQGNIDGALVSCGAPGNCAFTSNFDDAAQHSQVLADTETAGKGAWSDARKVLGFGTSVAAEVETLSCGGAGSCVIGGQNLAGSGGTSRAFVADETHGTWGAARRIAGNLETGGAASTNAVSCASPGNCAAGGFYEDSHGNVLPFIADESTATTTTLSLSAARVKAGHERSEHLSVQVKPRTSGTPAGQVTVTAGSARICVIGLRKGRGTCTLRASRLRPGTYHLVARYPGGSGYGASKSAKKTLTVTK
jgi:hypothetical protein